MSSQNGVWFCKTHPVGKILTNRPHRVRAPVVLSGPERASELDRWHQSHATNLLHPHRGQKRPGQQDDQTRGEEYYPAIYQWNSTKVTNDKRILYPAMQCTYTMCNERSDRKSFSRLYLQHVKRKRYSWRCWWPEESLFRGTPPLRAWHSSKNRSKTSEIHGMDCCLLAFNAKGQSYHIVRLYEQILIYHIYIYFF